MNTRTLFDLHSYLYLSLGCLTDNQRFAEFLYTPFKKFSKLNYTFREFLFDIEQLDFELGNEIELKQSKKNVIHDNFFIDKIYVMYFISKYGKVRFFKIKKFMGTQSYDGLVGIVKNKKLIGLLKFKEIKNEDNQ